MISEERLRELACEACDWRVLSRMVEAEAYEAAAKVCEARGGPIEVYNPGYVVMMECAAAIRALKKEGAEAPPTTAGG